MHVACSLFAGVMFNHLSNILSWKRHRLRNIIYLSLGLLIIGISFDLHSEESFHTLNFKQVLLNPSSPRIGEYDYGVVLYPNYRRQGLPDDFLIKKQPDISFKSSDIKSVKIAKTVADPNAKFYNITIVLTESAGQDLYRYTKLNENNRVAIEIDNEIISIPTIISPISDTMTIGGSDKSVDEIKAIFSKISKNISVDTHD
jgi:phosphohistidine swiveling domain-containing protein